MTDKIAMKTSALAFVLIIGTPERFKCGKQIGSYVGLIPCEDSSAGHQRLGHITKQGSSLLRFLLGEAAQAAARWDPDWRRRTYTWRCVGKGTSPSGHGPKTRGSDVLDVAERLGICRVGQARFARVTARYQAWRELERRPSEWASRSFARGSLQ